MNWQGHTLALVLTVALAGCSWVPKVKFWEDAPEVESGKVKLQEVRRALVCGTETDQAAIILFDSLEQLQAWDSEDALKLHRLDLPTDRSFVLVEQGLRRTGGYTIELRKQAEVTDQGTLQVHAEFLTPEPGRLTTQMITSLCVLAAVEKRPYRKVQLLDAAGELKAERAVVRAD